MDLNKILKIVVIIAILIVAGSVLYHYVIYLPNKAELQRQDQLRKGEQAEQEQLEKEIREREEKLESYKIKFQEDCDKKFDELHAQWENDLKIHAPWAVQMVLDTKTESCKTFPEFFKIDDNFYCSGGKLYEHIRSTYVPKCIEYKMQQMNL